MESFIFGVVIVAVVAVAVAISVAETPHRHARRRDFDALQASRPPLPAADFAAECGVPESIADRIRRVLAAVSEESYANPREPVEAARLRPDDDVCQELGYDLDSLSFFELLNGLEAEFGIRIQLADLLPQVPQPLTVRDIARIVAARLDERNG